MLRREGVAAAAAATDALIATAAAPVARDHFAPSEQQQPRFSFEVSRERATALSAGMVGKVPAIYARPYLVSL